MSVCSVGGVCSFFGGGVGGGAVDWRLVMIYPEFALRVGKMHPNNIKIVVVLHS